MAAISTSENRSTPQAMLNQTMAMLNQTQNMRDQTKAMPDQTKTMKNQPQAAALNESSAISRHSLETNNISFVELEVNCNAMEEAGIRYGDHIRVLRKDHCSNGQIIIAILNGQMLLRRYQTNGYQVQLVPASSGLSAIEVDTRISDFRIWGLVTHIIRKI